MVQVEVFEKLRMISGQSVSFNISRIQFDEIMVKVEVFKKI